MADLHVSRKSRENALLPTRAWEERGKTYKPDSSSHVCLSAVVPAFAEPDIHWLSRALGGPSQMIECVFAASPETNRSEASGDFSPSLSRPTAGPGSLRAV
jgi:hypothetical protein